MLIIPIFAVITAAVHIVQCSPTENEVSSPCDEDLPLPTTTAASTSDLTIAERTVLKQQFDQLPHLSLNMSQLREHHHDNSSEIEMIQKQWQRLVIEPLKQLLTNLLILNERLISVVENVDKILVEDGQDQKWNEQERLAFDENMNQVKLLLEQSVGLKREMDDKMCQFMNTFKNDQNLNSELIKSTWSEFKMNARLLIKAISTTRMDTRRLLGFRVLACGLSHFIVMQRERLVAQLPELLEQDLIH